MLFPSITAKLNLYSLSSGSGLVLRQCLQPDADRRGALGGGGGRVRREDGDGIRSHDNQAHAIRITLTAQVLETGVAADKDCAMTSSWVCVCVWRGSSGEVMLGRNHQQGPCCTSAAKTPERKTVKKTNEDVRGRRSEK